MSLYKKILFIIGCIFLSFSLYGCEKEDYYEAVAEIEGKKFYLDTDSINLITQYKDSLEKSYIESYDEYVEEGLTESDIKNKKRERFKSLKNYEIEKAVYEELILMDAKESKKVSQEEMDKMSANDKISLASDHIKALRNRYKPSDNEISQYINKNKDYLNYFQVVRFTFDSLKSGEKFYKSLEEDRVFRENILGLVRGLDEARNEESIIPDINKMGNYKVNSDSLVSFFKLETKLDFVFIPYGNKFNKQIYDVVKDMNIEDISRPMRLEKNWALGYGTELFILKNREVDTEKLKDEIIDLMKDEYLNDLLIDMWNNADINMIIGTTGK